MMLRIRKAMAQKEQGFTLIELLVVIIIIGILAAIAIPIFLNQRKKGVDASVKSDLKNAATAAEAYITDDPTGTAFTAANVTTNGGFKPSAGNTLHIKGSPGGGYCIRAFNTGASKAVSATASWYYDSNNGGILPATQLTAPATGPCAGADAWVLIS